jgi:hypothetical protein
MYHALFLEINICNNSIIHIYNVKYHIAYETSKTKITKIHSKNFKVK